MKAIIVLIAALLFLHFAKPALAVTVTISNYPSTITEDSFTLTASISGASTGTNYLRVDIFEDGTTSYFGETFNNTDWYGGSAYSQYLPISIQSGTTWEGNIQGRIGSPTTTQYDGSGVYKIRLRRYTSGGGYTSTEANNSAVGISIAIPTSTPTPTNTPTPAPTSTPTQTPTPTKTPTPTPIPNTPTANPLPTDILGESTESGSFISPTETRLKKNVLISNKSKSSNNVVQKISIGIGGIFLIACAILLVRFYIKSKSKKQDSGML